MQSKMKNAVVTVFSLLAFSAAIASTGTPSVQILGTRPNSLTIEFTLQNLRMDTVRVSGDDFLSITFTGATTVDAAGLPQIPYHVATIGIPVGARVRHQILEADYDVIESFKLLPNLSFKNQDGVVVPDYRPDAEAYASSQFYPAESVVFDAPSLFRDQQIVRLQVAGVRFLPEKKQIWKYNRIVLQIDFDGGEIYRGVAEVIRPGRDSEERMYRKMVLNYQQAMNWRKAVSREPKFNKTPSVFEFGTLYKFNVQQEGIYKIDGAFLESQNITLSSIVPAKIRLFNNGGRELPQSLTTPRPDGLVENARLVVDGGDGRFDRSDYILFYGVGLEGWDYNATTQKFSHYINHFNTANVYWLSFDGQQDGLRMEQVASGSPSGAIQETSLGMFFLEDELTNPLRSGLSFFGRQFAVTDLDRSRTFTINLPNAVASEPAQLQMRLVSVTPGNHRFAVSLNGSTLGNLSILGLALSFEQYINLQAADFTLPAANTIVNGSNGLQVSYSHFTGGQASSNGQAYMDWFEVFYTAQLRAIENQLAFTVSPQTQSQTYRIGNFSSDAAELYDITNYANVQKFEGFEFNGGNLTFTDAHPTGLPKRFLALEPSKYKTIGNLQRSEISDLRNPAPAAEYIIITHEDFYSEAQRLESLRENGSSDNRLETEVVRISDIFANFSGGLYDPTAIRDFIKYAFDNLGIRPTYVLLMGDGDFDPKNIMSKTDKNWIPTFQTNDLASASKELRELETRTTDSWFTYVSGNDSDMDLAIGRITVQTLNDAISVVDKIVAYETAPSFGGWRNTITMVGDDELIGNGRPSIGDVVHIDQTENIAESDIPRYFDVEKIYLSEFPKVIGASVGGVRKPAAKEALIQQINKGSLIVNYIGHGNPTVWSHESIFEQADNDRVQNDRRLTFFVAATCDWALFDNPDRQSQAEELLLADNRGAIGILTAARLVFSNSNYAFNRLFYQSLFNVSRATDRLGDALIFAHNRNGNQTNDEKFHLYGDPTLRLGAPQYEAVINSITPDSILALSTIEITGEVRQNGQLWSDFNGKALINTFDSKRSVLHVTEVNIVQDYFLPGNAIYRGAVSVVNGRFSAKFIVPKDISYGGNRARVSVYVWNDDSDGEGFRDNIIVSSTSSSLVDRDGPQMKVYFAGRENFASGDIIDANPTLVVELADTVSGINITGEIGHRLTLTIDPEEETCLSQLNRFLGITSTDLTDLFQFDEGSHLHGRVEFPLQFPASVEVGGQEVACAEPGNSDRRHTLVVKAWDNANNSSTATVEVLVVPGEGLVLRDVLNYPNPFTQSTTFTFISNLDAEVTIKIYTVAGQLIQTISDRFARSGFNMIEWDGRDANGDLPANGVYLFKLIARSVADSESSQREMVGKLAIVR